MIFFLAVLLVIVVLMLWAVGRRNGWVGRYERDVVLVRLATDSSRFGAKARGMAGETLSGAAMALT